MKVLMLPQLGDFGEKEESGIKRVIEFYHKYLPKYGVEFVEKGQPYDLLVGHAGASSSAVVSHCHGLYWTGDYNASKWEDAANHGVIESLKAAKIITVPSSWVAESIRRDMHINPIVLPHGIEWEEWQHNEDNGGYVLWNKNRSGDVCDPSPVNELAKLFHGIKFITTFSAKNPSNNIMVTGVLPHEAMKKTVQQAAVYLATTKETFGIGTLEAMAAGVPILGFNWGGTADLVEHGVNGYLAEPYNYDDLAHGLEYCLKNRDVLGNNGQILSKKYSWDEVARQIVKIYEDALVPESKKVSIIIPFFRKSEEQLRNALQSAMDQTYKDLEIIVVNDGSNCGLDTERISAEYGAIHISKANGGVATARNAGMQASTGRYICCLDADDALEPKFIATCVKALEDDPETSITYTAINVFFPDGRNFISQWPIEYDFDEWVNGAKASVFEFDKIRHLPNSQEKIERQKKIPVPNYIPTCCVFRREMFERLGGYRQRFAPFGAGSEDAEFWFRAGSFGFTGKKASSDPLFRYSIGVGGTSRPEYRHIDTFNHFPWLRDDLHNFSSAAKPVQRHAHKVRQYDRPLISVVIPVGEGHVGYLVDALDSLEAQTLRQWEAIVVWDIPNDIPSYHKSAFPFVKWVETGGVGAGAARNRGAEMARAPLLLFLDADDYLEPDALSKMLDAYNNTSNAISSEYYGISLLDDESVNLLSPDMKSNIVDRIKDWTKIRNYKHVSENYDCERAIKQPENDLNKNYIWCLITTLHPRSWWKELGGFDESLESWEDWDYWIRMARAGKCFTSINEPLLNYRFYSGQRREDGIKKHKSIVQYLVEKREKAGKIMCGTCGKAKYKPVVAPVGVQQQNSNTITDENLLLIEYMHPSIGGHSVIGVMTKTKYGYHAHGDRFLVHKADIAAQPNLYRVIEVTKEAPTSVVMHDEIVIDDIPDPRPIVEPEASQHEVSVIEEQETTVTAETTKRGRKKAASERSQ